MALTALARSEDRTRALRAVFSFSAQTVDSAEIIASSKTWRTTLAGLVLMMERAILPVEFLRGRLALLFQDRFKAWIERKRRWTLRPCREPGAWNQNVLPFPSSL